MKRWIWMAALAAMATACGPQDEDGDGFAGELDCDESSADVFPGADETCDGIDNDCDGEVDEFGAGGSQVYFQDGDADGFGSPEATVLACAQPEGFVQRLGDCDDANGLVYPAAPELCDDLDNDCDFLIDDDIAEGEGAAFHSDRDGDGFGAVNESIRSCEAIDGYTRVEQATDCDDFNTYVNPDAVERCDFIDNNCDSFVDEGTAVDASLWYADVDEDTFGDPAVEQSACFQPENYVADNTDCDDTTELVNPSLEEICNDGLDQNCNGLPDQCSPYGWNNSDNADVEIALPSGESWDDSLDVIGDVNGDGFPEFAVSDYFGETYCTSSATSTTSGSSCGSVLILGGDQFDFDVEDVDATSDYLAMFEGYSSDYFGEDGAQAGDIDGDGFMDLVFGGDGVDGRNVTDTGTNSSSGGVAIVWGSATGFDQELDRSDATMLWGSGSSDYFGEGLSVPGDLDGDGTDDLLVGADGWDSPSSSAGKLYIIYGSATRLTEQNVDGLPGIIGSTSFDYLGDGSSYDRRFGAGDFDGDGTLDVFVSSDDWDDRTSGTVSSVGRVGVFYGDGTQITGNVAFTDSDAAGQGAQSFSYFGYTSGVVKDLNDDGYDELAVNEGYSDDAAYLFFGSSTQWGDGDLDSGNANLTFNGTGDIFYYENPRSADFQGDGKRDLVMSQYCADPNGMSCAGTIYVFLDAGELAEGTYDVDDADLFVNGSSASEYIGRRFDVGDLNNDGLDDLISMAYTQDRGFVWFGKGL